MDDILSRRKARVQYIRGQPIALIKEYSAGQERRCRSFFLFFFSVFFESSLAAHPAIKLPVEMP